ncbi:glycosyltransferase family 2 protein [Flavobacterium amnicola]|uniref:Glycosyltransferase family 2 protein n=1 Tax=Flavobacterium amnicola TaxID=2506422 RepID=A0A4Q1K0T2_9FLAO|nr:glycosyltransferase family A protein [Flavobacterium amnicola]RXR17757.1 glycosyltransferase family 2 protein [Flavobacterium amnicola]
MIHNNPKVSVVIPCYNDKDYIQETVQSVLNQTFQDFEIIIVDDGSDEATKRVLSGFKNEKLQIITQLNQGSSIARNNGFKVAKAEYILTLDGDDTFDTRFLEKAVPILDENQRIGAVSCYCNIFVNNHQIIHQHSPKGGSVDDFLFDNNSVSFALIRKKCWETIGGYDEKMKNGFEDWEFWIALTKSGWTIFTIPEFLFNYRQKEAQLSLDKASKIYHREANLKYIYLKHQELYQKHFTETVTYLTDLADRNKKNELKYKNAIEFKIGKLILQPFRYIKNCFKS